MNQLIKVAGDVYRITRCHGSAACGIKRKRQFMLGHRHLSLVLVDRDSVNTRINLEAPIRIGLIELLGNRLVIVQTSDGLTIVLGIITS